MGKKLLTAAGFLLGILVLIFLQGLTDAATAVAGPVGQTEPDLQEEEAGYSPENIGTLSRVRLAETETLVCYEDRIVARFFYGPEEQAHIEAFGRVMGLLREQYPGIEEIYVVPVPDRVVSEPDFPYDRMLYRRLVRQLEDSVGDSAAVVDPWPALSEHTSEYLFFRTEKGWTARGAYYGSTALCEAMGIEPIPLEEYDEYWIKESSFSGTFFRSFRSGFSEEERSVFAGIKDDEALYYLLPQNRNREKLLTHSGRWLTEPMISVSRDGENSFVGNDTFLRAVIPGRGMAEELAGETVLFLCDQQGKILAPFASDYCGELYVANITWDHSFLETLPDLIREYGISRIVIAQSASRIGDPSYSAALSSLFHQKEEPAAEETVPEETAEEGTADASADS